VAAIAILRRVCKAALPGSRDGNAVFGEFSHKRCVLHDGRRSGEIFRQVIACHGGGRSERL
jgi:hypothetical protein